MWAIMFALFEKDAKPGGRLFMLIALFVSCYVSGWLISFIKLPPLLGMLVCGLIFANVGLFEMYGVYKEIVVGVR